MKNDLSIYSHYAHERWIAGSPRFRSLQNLTPFRLSLIEDCLGELKDKDVLDLGCGGGLISIPLIERGARLTGVDLSEESIKQAITASKGRGRFIVGDVTLLDIEANSVDYVLIVDVLDHVQDFARVLLEASRVLKPGGRLFVGTINRTPIAHLLTITLGETLGFIRKGTHDSKLFIKPNELIEAARRYDLKLLNIIGEWPVFFETLLKGAITLRRSKSTAVAYSAVFEKEVNAQ